MEDADKLVLYRCPMCQTVIGRVDECGALVIAGLFRTLRVDLVCTCGYVVYWRRSDVKLERLIERTIRLRKAR